MKKLLLSSMMLFTTTALFSMHTSKRSPLLDDMQDVQVSNEELMAKARNGLSDSLYCLSLLDSRTFAEEEYCERADKLAKVQFFLEKLSEKSKELQLKMEAESPPCEIADLKKGAVLYALYQRARPENEYESNSLTSREKKKLTANGQRNYIQSFKGRSLGVNVSMDSFDTREYNKENGPAAAQKAIATLRDFLASTSQ